MQLIGKIILVPNIVHLQIIDKIQNQYEVVDIMSKRVLLLTEYQIRAFAALEQAYQNEPLKLSS